MVKHRVQITDAMLHVYQYLQLALVVMTSSNL